MELSNFPSTRARFVLVLVIREKVLGRYPDQHDPTAFRLNSLQAERLEPRRVEREADAVRGRRGHVHVDRLVLVQLRFGSLLHRTQSTADRVVVVAEMSANALKFRAE